MAKAKNTSSAASANKPIHRIQSGKIHLSVWEGNRATLQRAYTYEGKAGYADSFRVEDLHDLRRVFDQFVIWAETPKDEATPQKEAAAVAGK
jgi:hypothetical protein